MAAITIRMSIIRMVHSLAVSLSAKLKRALVPFLVLASAALFHAMLVSALLALGFTGAADVISINNPDVAEAQAHKYRAVAVEEGVDADSKQQALTSSLEYWQQAISARPLWPYYHLGALDVEVLLQDKAAVQQRIKHIITLAPNERGLDKNFLILGFIAWHWIEAEEQQWLLTRLNQVNRSVLKYVFSYAKQSGNHRDICTQLPWKKVRALCKQ